MWTLNGICYWLATIVIGFIALHSISDISFLTEGYRGLDHFFQQAHNEIGAGLLRDTSSALGTLIEHGHRLIEHAGEDAVRSIENS